MDKLKITETKLLRGDIVEKLYLYYGTDIKLSVLRSALRIKGYVDDEEIKKAIFYLGGEGKRYVHVEVNPESWADSLIWLTPAGVNLAEKDDDDKGVIMDE